LFPVLFCTGLAQRFKGTLCAERCCKTGEKGRYSDDLGRRIIIGLKDMTKDCYCSCYTVRKELLTSLQSTNILCGGRKEYMV
jgi:hypothetical protein